MHDWLAMALFALGLGLIASGIRKRRSRLQSLLLAGAIRPEFAAMGEIVRPLVLTFVSILAVKLALLYFVFGGQRFLTPLDFAGILFVLLTYSGWLIAATTRRRVQAAADASEPDQSAMQSAA